MILFLLHTKLKIGEYMSSLSISFNDDNDDDNDNVDDDDDDSCSLSRRSGDNHEKNNVSKLILMSDDNKHADSGWSLWSANLFLRKLTAHTRPTNKYASYIILSVLSVPDFEFSVWQDESCSSRMQSLGFGQDLHLTTTSHKYQKEDSSMKPMFSVRFFFFSLSLFFFFFFQRHH